MAHKWGCRSGTGRPDRDRAVIHIIRDGSLDALLVRVPIMSVPVVPLKTANQTTVDADSELTWPPPEDQPFALDIMDLETRRVITTEDAADQLSPAGSRPMPLPREAPSRPIAVVTSKPAARAGVPWMADAEKPQDLVPPHRAAFDHPRFRRSLRLPAAVAGILVQAIVIAAFLTRGRWARGTDAVNVNATAEAPRASAGAAVRADVGLPPEAARVPPRAPDTRGRLFVRSDPPGATVVVDGQRRGTTPFTVEELAAGGHRVQLGSGSSSIEQNVTIEAGATTTLVVPMQSAAAAGWLNVAAPIAMQVLENGRVLGSSAEGPLRLSAGTHRLQLVNEVLGYRSEETVAIRGGDMMRLRPSLPDGVLHVNAQPWANVWVDGQRVGETPLANVKVALGQHEIRFRHPSLGEQVRQVVVSAAEPARVSVNMKP